MQLKRQLALMCALCVLVAAMAGCAGQSAGIDALQAENATLAQQNRQLAGQVASLQKQLEATGQNTADGSGQAEVEVELGGWFVATVRQILPDYTLDGETPCWMVLTFFQACPFLMWVGGSQDVLDGLEEGGTYYFQLQPIVLQISPDTLALYEAWPEIALYREHPFIELVRAPQAQEAGLESVGLTFTVI